MVENLKKDPEIINEINLNNNQNENEKFIKNNEKDEEEKIEIDKIKQDLINKQIDLCKQLKKESDEYLKNNQLSKASNTYTKAVLNVKYLIEEKLISKKLKEELEKEILIPSNLNLSYIDIQYKNGKRYSIWLPQEVNIALKLLVEEDEEGEYTEDELTCTFDIHGNAIWDNINTIEG